MTVEIIGNNMEREELLKNAKALYEYHFTSDKLKHELEDAFPELKESEDDRVRNRLITLIHVLDEIFFSGDNPSKEQCLTYLERQKSVERSDEDKATLEYSDPFKRFVDMIHSVDKDEFMEFEWSIINFVLACCDKNIAMTPKGIHRYTKTILNIVKKEFSSKIYSWTDEEETVLHNACELIRHRLNDSTCRNGSIGGMDYKELYEKLKSLHPAWKPSKEQPIDKNTLTWKDINDLERIINNVHYEFRAGIGEKSFGEEVLERFREERDE